MAKKSFVQGAVVLGIAGIIIKVLGAFFRIPLANLIGSEGMGYYQTAYPVYVLFLTLATAGIPIAISRMVSERIAVHQYAEAHKVFKVSFILLFAIGAVSASICFFGAGALVNSMGNPGARYAMMAIAPALLFVPVQAAYRGYFQGMQDMRPTAISQVTEQMCRVGCGLFLAYYLVRFGRQQAAAGASFGATAGAIGGIITVIILYYMARKGIKGRIAEAGAPAMEKSSDILGKIFIIAIPITIGAAIMPIMNAIDVAIVMSRLQATGWTEDAANSMYGQLTGMAGPLINFPQVLTQAVAMSLVPAVAAAFKVQDMEHLRENVKTGLRMSIIIGFPCALGLMSLSKPIMMLLYPMQRESAISAAPCLFIMAFGVIFLSTVQTLTGVLQGVGKQMIPVRNLFIGAIFKVIITYTLTGVEFINVKGAAIGTVAAYFIAASLNVMAVKKYTGANFDLGLTYIKPGISTLVMSAATVLAYKVMSLAFGNALSTLVAVGVAMVTYCLMLFVTRCITREEIAGLPKGRLILKVLDKFHR